MWCVVCMSVFLIWSAWIMHALTIFFFHRAILYLLPASSASNLNFGHFESASLYLSFPVAFYLYFYLSCFRSNGCNTPFLLSTVSCCDIVPALFVTWRDGMHHESTSPSIYIYLYRPPLSCSRSTLWIRLWQFRVCWFGNHATVFSSCLRLRCVPFLTLTLTLCVYETSFSSLPDGAFACQLLPQLLLQLRFLPQLQPSSPLQLSWWKMAVGTSPSLSPPPPSCSPVPNGMSVFLRDDVFVFHGPEQMIYSYILSCCMYMCLAYIIHIRIASIYGTFYYY